jgi:membrane-bound lytic murein transglycosylase D
VIKTKSDVSIDSLKTSWIFNLNKNSNIKSVSTVTIKDASFYLKALTQLNLNVPIVANDRVLFFINLFLNEQHNATNFTVNLSDKYSTVYNKYLKRKNIPSELMYLAPTLSSNNNLFIYSSGTVGTWQLLYPQARLYKLNVSSLIDERRDIDKSSIAAAAYLKDLYDMYNDWPMAITAFACSPALLNKAIRRSGGEMKLEKIYNYLPKDIRDTYYAFMAYIYIHNYKEDCKIKSQQIDLPIKSDSITTERNISLAAVSTQLKISLKQLHFLNPIYRTDIVPKQNILYLPSGMLANFIHKKDSIYYYHDSILYRPISFTFENNIANNNTKVTTTNEVPDASKNKTIYKVKSGDNLGYIATLYNVKVSDIQKWNNINGTKINVGQNLIIYVSASKANAYKNINVMSSFQKEKIIEKNTLTEEEIDTLPDEKKWHIYIVKSGDNLFNIAKKYPGVSADKIMENNSITEEIQPGQKLKIKLK